MTLPASSKKLASMAPEPVAEYHPPAVVPEESHSKVIVSEVSNSAVSHAMQGSILSAGLPDAPRIQSLSPSSRAKSLTLQDPLH
jgi:hypothetical protein